MIDMLVSKYADGLPLHRQRERYKRLGFDIPVATLVDQVRWSTTVDIAHIRREYHAAKKS